MDISARTVLIVGGTSGIGRELASRLAAAGSEVVVGGRRTDLLEELRGEGLATVEVDVTDPASVLAARDAVLDSHPGLDTVVTMAGVMVLEDVLADDHLDTAETTVAVNLLGTIRTVGAFLPHLVGRGAGTVVTVGSGIGFVPFPPMPSYGATKAGVHAYSEALRAQLEGTGVDVVELVPPAVATTARQAELNPHAVPLDAFATEVMAALGTEPTPREVLVEAVRRLRWAERDGTYREQLVQRTKALAMLPGRAGA